MLLNDFRPDKDDRFYFLFRLRLGRHSVLSVTFSVPVAAIVGRSVTGKQFLTMCGGFVLILAVDFISVWIKAYSEYKEMERIERETFGRRKTH